EVACCPARRGTQRVEWASIPPPRRPAAPVQAAGPPRRGVVRKCRVVWRSAVSDTGSPLVQLCRFVKSCDTLRQPSITCTNHAPNLWIGIAAQRLEERAQLD